MSNTVSQEQKENKALLVALGLVVAACIVLAIIGFVFLDKPADIIEGQADATSIRISGKLPGRVADIYVSEGDMVKAGDTLVHIHSSVVDAQLGQAEAMRTVATATDKKVDAGTRIQIINTAASLLSQAEAAETITKKTYQRMERLYGEGVISEQKRDEAKAAYDAAVAAKNAAASQLSLAKAGAQQEDKTAAEAMVKAADSGVAQVNAILEDSYLTAPFDGTIDQIYPEVGELVAMGAPIMNLLRTGDRYVVFNVREELLNDMPMGKELKVMIPALGKRK